MVENVGVGDATVIEALRRGDERVFAEVVDRLHPTLRRVARGYVRTEEAIGDVVQETWIGVLRGIDRFEGRSSLRTWVVSILVNVARSHAVKEARTVPFAALGRADEAGSGFAPDRFQGPAGEYPGHWSTPPTPWSEDPVAAALAGETRELVARAVAELPDTQRAVITLRDVEDWTGPEVAAALGISEGNQRVLLHRARARVRLTLDEHLLAVEGRAR
ncbi:MAG: RNA polymerase sigma factor [Kineosporiaceae bacterium]